MIKEKTPKNGLHPTQKPVALMEYLIRTYTNEGETVLDFTMGSGTTGVAAKNLGRKFMGIELDQGYFDIAVKRIGETNIMADFADDAAEITENYLQVALQNAREQPRPHPFTGICRNCDHPVARALSALVESAAMITSGERYKAGKEKPHTGALFNYNPRNRLNFQILVFSRQACHLYQCRLRLVEPFSGRVPVVGLPHAQGVSAKAGCFLERPLLHATVVSQCQQKIDLQSHNLFLFVFTVNHYGYMVTQP